MDKLKKDIIDYWDKQPCMSNRSNNKIKSIDFYKDIDSLRKIVIDPWNYVSDFLSIERFKNKKILEIGCGIGIDAEEFAKITPGYTAIDISSSSVEYAKARFTNQNLTGNFCVGDASDSGIFENFSKQDLVYSSGVIHHWPEPGKIIDNVYNIMHNDSEFIFNVYAKHSWKSALVNSGLARYESQENCPYIKLYSLDDIQILLGKRFEIIDSMQSGLFMYNLELYKNNQLVLEPWFDCMPDEIKKSLYKNLGEMLYVKAKKAKS